MSGLTSKTYTSKRLESSGNLALFLERAVTIASGNNLAAGTVLGKVTASGKYVAYASGASDGSENPVGVLSKNVDATSEDKTGSIYLRGQFWTDGLVGMDANALSALPAFVFESETILR